MLFGHLFAIRTSWFMAGLLFWEVFSVSQSIVEICFAEFLLAGKIPYSWSFLILFPLSCPFSFFVSFDNYYFSLRKLLSNRLSKGFQPSNFPICVVSWEFKSFPEHQSDQDHQMRWFWFLRTLTVNSIFLISEHLNKNFFEILLNYNLFTYSLIN
jgi:hypothetical protein